MSSPSNASGDPPKDRGLWKRFLKAVPHKGHKNLFIRGSCAMAHAVLSFVLAAAGENRPNTLLNGILQFIGALTLFYQFRTANPYMFIARGLASWGRVVVILHGAVCGGANWPGGKCTTEAWSDVRTPFRVLACLGALRMYLNGQSLMLQYKFPRRGVGQHGNVELFYRGFIQASGIPLNFISPMLKLGELSDTQYQRATIEIVVHFIRAFIVVPMAVWSLFDQWVATGAGKKTDDIRTSNQGEAHPNAADKLTAKISPHKGHRNLLIRCWASFGQGTLTAWLVAYDHGRPAACLYMIAQVVSSMTLFYQWKTGYPKMFLARASANWFACIVSIYATKCGANWPGDVCADKPWDDNRRSLRIVAACASARLFFNGLSLVCQYKFPYRMFGGHGNEQLFIRGCIQATGVPIHIARFFLKTVEFDGAHPQIDYTINALRALVLIPIGSASLFHQWRHTSPGNTGHPASDLFERDMNPGVVQKDERLRVTIISAKGLRNADVMGKSDPYAVCTVHGRPESTFQTQVVDNTLAPEWNQTQEMPVYKHLDSLEFVVRDHDEESKVPCCKMFDDGDDLLGKAVLKSDQIHSTPGGFSGEVQLTHAGRTHKHAVINIKVELLGEKTEEDGFATVLGKEVQDAAKEVGEAVDEVIKDVEETVTTAATTLENMAGISDSQGENDDLCDAEETIPSRPYNPIIKRAAV